MWGIDQIAPRDKIPSLSLETYADWLGIDECAFYGIRRAGDPARGCDYYWDQTNRVQLANAIRKAERRLEKHLGFPLSLRFFCQESHDWKCPILLSHRRVRSVCTETIADIADGVATNLDGNDEAIITFNTDLTEPCEIVIYYPSQTTTIQYIIHPSDVQIAAGVATVTIPRCRLLIPELFIDYGSNTAARPDYANNVNFLRTVDIKRRWGNTAVGAIIVWHRTCEQIADCGCDCGDLICEPPSPCAWTEQAGCGLVTDSIQGAVQLEPAAFADGSWSKSSWTYDRRPDKAKVSYAAGYYDACSSACVDLEETHIRAIIGLAHSNLPEGFCSCAIQDLYYKRDTKPLEPAVRTPFGWTWGAFEAWEIVKEEALGFGGVL